MLKKYLICIFALISSLAFTQANADSPNLYTCKGAGVSLTYSPTGFGPPTPAGVNLLSLTLGNKHYSAQKANIETSKSVMGDIKSITIKFLPDVSIQKVSFILPEISFGTNFLNQLVTQQNFKSQLAVTTIATPFIATPFVGIVNKSSYTDLNCTASIAFLPL